MIVRALKTLILEYHWRSKSYGKGSRIDAGKWNVESRGSVSR